jgi:CrcB protein
LGPVVAVVSVGGGLGSVARYGLAQWIHPAGDGFPVPTLLTNLVGALLLGILVVAVTEVWPVHPLVRPALGTGVLGGFTTFSTFAVESRGLPLWSACLYVAATLVGGIGLTALGMTGARRLSRGGPVAMLDPDLP